MSYNRRNNGNGNWTPRGGRNSAMAEMTEMFGAFEGFEKMMTKLSGRGSGPGSSNSTEDEVMKALVKVLKDANSQRATKAEADNFQQLLAQFNGGAMPASMQ